MRFGKFSSKNIQKETIGAPSSASGGLLPVTTGVDATHVKTPVKEVVAVKDRPHQSHKKSALSSRVLPADDDLLMEAFDNDIDESEDAVDAATFSALTLPPKSSASVDKVSVSEREMQQPSRQRVLLLAHQITEQTTALHNMNQAYVKLQQQMVRWQEQAVSSGRAALKAKKQDPVTGKIILTNECKLQLLRRKLLKVNLATAEQQLVRLEMSYQALEQDIERNKERLLIQQQSQQAKKPHDASVVASNDILLPLEQELEHVDVVKEILSRDLAKDLIPDDDTVSEMEYDEAELLQELQTLSSMDEEDDCLSRLPEKSQSKRSGMKQASPAATPSSKAKKSSPKRPSTKSISSFKATLF